MEWGSSGKDVSVNAVILRYCFPILRNDDSIDLYIWPHIVIKWKLFTNWGQNFQIGFSMTPLLLKMHYGNNAIKGVNTHWKIHSDPFFAAKKFTW